MTEHYITGHLETPAGKIPRVSPVWKAIDVWSTIKVRWSIGRMNYKVNPGLYAIGEPDEQANVFVTGNFKLSFDHLRKALKGMNAWILVLDTKGINVWCAAGKGTFGTQELMKRIRLHNIEKLVSHRKVIVPQLGATGVSAHEVKNQSGFHVIYGPVRAEDIPDYVARGYQATPEMRKVDFPVKERIKLIPVEIMSYGNYLILACATFFILSGFSKNGYSFDLAWTQGGKSIVNLLTAYFAGCVITPMLLPYIPFTRFSAKGLFAGWIFAGLLFYFHFLGNSIIEHVSWFLMIGGLSAFVAMNFTGSSTITSLSGVQKEMKIAVPLQIGFVGVGFIGWLFTRFY